MKFTAPGALRPDAVYKTLAAHEFEEGTNVGFRELDISEGNVSGFAIKRSPVFVKVFDPVSRNLIDREEFIVTEVFFSLDLGKRLIEVYSTPRRVASLVTTFFQTVGDTYSLTALNVSIPLLLNFFRSTSPASTTIHKLFIGDYVGEKGALGNYDIKAVDTKLAWRLLEEYPQGIRQVSLTTDISGSSIPLQIFQSGKFRIISRQDDVVRSVIKKIKDGLQGEKEN